VSDVDTLLQIPRLPRVLQRVARNFDISRILEAIVMAVVRWEGMKEEEKASKLQGSIEKLLKQKDLLNLKAFYMIITSLLHFLMERPDHQEQNQSKSKSMA